jgi:hypothetical protein
VIDNLSNFLHSENQKRLQQNFMQQNMNKKFNHIPANKHIEIQSSLNQVKYISDRQDVSKVHKLFIKEN